MKKTKRVSVPKSQQLELFSKQRRSRSAEPRAGSSKQDPRVARKTSRVPHETRPEVNGPLHVVLRIRRGLPGLRTPRATWTKRGAPDPYSSGRWFRPWRCLDFCRGTRRPAVVDARSYGWMPYIHIDHVPGPHSHALTS